jgi:hypothetical protein
MPPSSVIWHHRRAHRARDRCDVTGNIELMPNEPWPKRITVKNFGQRRMRIPARPPRVYAGHAGDGRDHRIYATVRAAFLRVADPVESSALGGGTEVNAQALDKAVIVDL